MKLRYGVNPAQGNASAEPLDGLHSPVSVLNGSPSYINLLDVLNAWQLVREASLATGQVAAASFKHVSPAGAALGLPLSAELAEVYEVHGAELSPAALAYVRARGADPKSSYGDMAAVSATVDLTLARYLAGVVSDGIVAPGYDADALEVLKGKKRGGFLVVQADPAFEPPPRQQRDVFGLRLTQDADPTPISDGDLASVKCGELTNEARRDLLLALATVRYTQSNSVAYALGGQVIGVGAGQQSRVDCTKLAGSKADTWWLLRHPKVRGLAFHPGVKRQDRINWRVRLVEGDLTDSELEGLAQIVDAPASPLSDVDRKEWLLRLEDVSLASDGFLPFPDNVEQARRHGVRYVAAPGGGTRDEVIIETCRQSGMTLVFTPRRYFHH